MDGQAKTVHDERSKVNHQKVEQVFKQVQENCNRSETKQDLHEDDSKDLYLAGLLEQVRIKYGDDICVTFQLEYEKTNGVLSYLFARVTSAVLQSTFRQGRCGGQADYCLFELFKADIFSATLVWSRAGANTEHYYNVIPIILILMALVIQLQHVIMN